MPPGSADDALLWGDPLLSDLRGLIYPAGDGPDGAWSSGKPEPLASLPLHSSVLCKVSPGHFRGHIERLFEQHQAAVTPQHGQHDDPANESHATSAEETDASMDTHGSSSGSDSSSEADEGLPRLGKRPRMHKPDDQQPPLKRLRQEVMTAPAKVLPALELTLRPGKPEAVPEAVLHHAYTGILPDDAALIAWVMWRADYHDMPATVQDCLTLLQHLVDSHNLTPQAVIILSSLPALQTGAGSSAAVVERLVARMARETLRAQLGANRRRQLAAGGKLSLHDLLVISNLPALQGGSCVGILQQAVSEMAYWFLPDKLHPAHDVLVQKDLLDQFVQLPFLMVKQWATPEWATSGSDTTVAVLITAWYGHQCSRPPPATAPTEQQCKELSALICLKNVSPSFRLHVMPHLKWYQSSQLCDTKWFDPHRCARSFIWTLSCQQLRQLWVDGCLTLSYGIYYAGFKVHMRLHLDELPVTKPGSTAGRGVEQQPGAAAAEGRQTAGVGQQSVAGAAVKRQTTGLEQQQPAAGAAMGRKAAGVEQQQQQPAAGAAVKGQAAGADQQQRQQQQPVAGAPVGRRTLGLYLWLDWPSILANHGSLRDKVPDPSVSLNVGYKVGPFTSFLGENVVTLSHRRLRGWKFVDFPFSEFCELASFLGPARKVKVTLDNEADWRV